jgi:FtsH-binding integral membrane protein
MDIYYNPADKFTTSEPSDVGLFATLIAIVGIIIALVSNTRKPLTTGNYVANTYLYILLAILICSLSIIIMDKYNLLNNISTMTAIVIFIIVLVVMSALLMIDKGHVVLRHILWIIFIVGIAVILFPIYDVAKQTSVLWKSLITVIILVLGLTFIASRFPRDYFKSWGSYLVLGLVALIIFEVLDLIFSDNTSLHSHQKIFGIIAVVLFSGFVLYDTNQVYDHADQAVINCQGIAHQLECADYPGESLNIFLDIINLFSNTTMLQRP